MDSPFAVEIEEKEFRPQPKQELFLSSEADIAIYGGAAGAGKTYALLLEPLRHVDNRDFGALIFRREAKMITIEGGLRDTALGIYSYFGGDYRSQPRIFFRFPSGARISFEHIHQEEEVYNYQGAQIPFIGFDELTHFTKKQFTYLMSRNRSTCGVKPYIRATCNADSESWVAELIEWWIDQDEVLEDGTPNRNYGFPIQERGGVIRYFITEDERIIWGDNKDQLLRLGADIHDIKSLTFIPALVWDNPALLSKDPGYIANLKAQNRVERARLLDGNWKIKPTAGAYFNRYEVSLIQEIPNDVIVWVRSWDLAATEFVPGTKADWTAGVRVGKRANGNIVIADLVHTRRKASDIRALLRRVCEMDGKQTRVWLPQEPGQAGLDQAQTIGQYLEGYNFAFHPVAKHASRLIRAEPVAAQWQVGNIEVVKAFWNKEFFDEMEGFPSLDMHDDIVDATIDGVNYLMKSTQTYAASKSRRGIHEH